MSVKVPKELQAVPANILEDYVEARLLQILRQFAPRLQQLIPAAQPEIIEGVMRHALQAIPPPDYSQIQVEDMDLQLVFRHECLALGCLDPQCVMCQHNPHRRCSVNFDRKYLVNDQLKAKCNSVIRVELINRSTGQLVEEDLPDIRLEMCILDGNLYDNRFMDPNRAQQEASADIDSELDACALMMNNKQQPLLISGGGVVNDSAGRVILQLKEGRVLLSDLQVTDSSEALLSGRKPPFRLLVRAVHKDGRSLKIRHAVSEGFVVATRRTRTANKVEIPSVEDPVQKLEHMGRETVKKLQDLRTAAMQAGIEIDIPENCVQKVGEFKQLALRAEQDGHLRQKLQHILKLSKEKWDEARDHAMRAVVADNRMRAWYVDRRTMELGILFTCLKGMVKLDEPVGLLQRRIEGGEAKVEATLMDQQTPAQRELVRQLQPRAADAWWEPGHPGWAIFPMDSEQFRQTRTLAIMNNWTPEPTNLPPLSPNSPAPDTQWHGPPMPSQGYSPHHLSPRPALHAPGMIPPPPLVNPMDLTPGGPGFYPVNGPTHAVDNSVLPYPMGLPVSPPLPLVNPLPVHLPESPIAPPPMPPPPMLAASQPPVEDSTARNSPQVEEPNPFAHFQLTEPISSVLGDLGPLEPQSSLLPMISAEGMANGHPPDCGPGMLGSDLNLSDELQRLLEHDMSEPSLLSQYLQNFATSMDGGRIHGSQSLSSLLHPFLARHDPLQPRDSGLESMQSIEHALPSLPDVNGTS